MLQGRYISNNLVGIEEYFENLAQATAEDRGAVSNLSGAYIKLMTQVVEYANYMTTKNSSMATMYKTISQLQGGIKTLKSKLAVHTTKRTGAAQNQKK